MTIAGTPHLFVGAPFVLRKGLEQVAEGYRSMDERRAIRALLRP
jgi:hypothetical protein